MPKLTDLMQLNELARERGDLTRALANLDHNAKIIGLTLSEGEQALSDEPRIAVMLTGVEWPPEMQVLLKPAVQKRLAAVSAELRRLGFTE